MKRIYYIISILLLTLMSRSVAYAELPQKGTWSGQILKASEEVYITDEVHIAGPIIIPSGKTLTIKRYSTGGSEIRIRPLSTFTGRDGYPTCLFYVEEGGRLHIQGHDVTNAYISIVGNSEGAKISNPISCTNDVSTLDVDLSNNLTTFEESKKTIDSKVGKTGFPDFVNGGLICAVGQVELRYVQLWGMYATTGRSGAIYRPKQPEGTGGYVYNTITIRDTYIRNNMTSYGAAIMVDKQIETAKDKDDNSPTKCAITLQDVEIYHNVTVSNSDAGVIRSNEATIGNLYIYGGKIRENFSYGSGGAIYWNARGHEETKLQFRAAQVVHNYSRYNGAGLMLECSVEFLKEGSESRTFIRKNVADCFGENTGIGGGVLVRTHGNASSSYNPTINIDFNANVVVRGNKAYNGAAIAYDIVNNSVIASGTDINLKVSGAEIDQNIASNNGGGIYLKDNNTSLDVNFTLSGNTNIHNNTASGSGGGLYLEKGSNRSKASTIKFNKGSITSNTATNGSGGGIHMVGLNITSDTNASGITVASNTSKTNGGGISVDGTGGGVSMTISNGVIGGNAESDANKSDTGGGIYVSKATLIINGGVIKNNKSLSNLHGGGGVAAEKSTVTVSGGSILNNDSGTANGGGLFLKNCTTVFDGGEISGNKTIRNGANTGFGGGVYVIQDGGTSRFDLTGTTTISGNSANVGGGILLDGGTSNMDGGVITGNTSETDGGGIYVRAGSLTLTNGTVSENDCKVDGGGIAFESPGQTLTITGGTISSNTSVANGGGIHVGNGNLTISGGVIDSNRTTNESHGGGVAFIPETSGKMIVEDGTISNNVAANNAGGIFIAAGTLEVTGGRIFGNSSGTNGGALCMMDHGTYNPISVTISGGKIYSNYASSLGGGVYIKTTGTMKITDGEIYQNTCNFQGGGINVGQTGGLTIEGGIIRNNTANHSSGGNSGNGGGLYISGGTLMIKGGTIKDNNGYSGAGICQIGGTCNISGGTILSNSSQNHGGGLYISGGTCSFTKGVIDNNSAQQLGGGVYMTGSTAVLTMTGGQISNNNARGGGGAYLANQSVLNFGDGLIINNKALCMDPSVSKATTGYKADVSQAQYQGVGGGVCVGNAVLKFDSKTNSLGLYGNQADLLGDDIFSTGAGSSLKVYLPSITEMNLSGYNAVTTDLQWMEDYANNDTGYIQGSCVNKSEGYVPKRYRQAVADKNDVYQVNIDSLEDPIFDEQEGKFYFKKYLALAVGYDVKYMVIQRKGLMKGENAIYKISKKNGDNWETYAHVLVSGPEEATTPELAVQHPATKSIAVIAGMWRVEEIGWDWAYEGTSTIEREVSSSTSKEDMNFVFTTSKVTELKDTQYSESVVINDFGRGTVVTQ